MKKFICLSAISATAALTGCGSDSSSSPKAPELSNQHTAIVMQAVFGQGSNAAITDADDLSTMVQGYYADTQTDYAVRSNGDNYYVIGRGSIDLIHKYDTENPNASYYGAGYSLKDAGQASSSNVHDMAFVSDNKAILSRYAQGSAWIVDPTAQNADDFKVAEIDLSAYIAADDTQTPAPEMESIALFNNKAFILMQRQGDETQGYGYPRSAYAAVIDTADNSEIDTAPQTEGLKGVELEINNPGNLAINGKDLYVQGIDYRGGYTGGLIKIDMETYEQTVIYDATEATGSISDVAIVNDDIYVVVYHGWKDNSLAKVDSTDGSFEIVDAYKNEYLSFITTGPEGNLWIGRGNSGDDKPSKLIKLNKEDLSEMDSVEMDLDPIGITFVTTQN